MKLFYSSPHRVTGIKRRIYRNVKQAKPVENTDQPVGLSSLRVDWAVSQCLGRGQQSRAHSADSYLVVVSVSVILLVQLGRSDGLGDKALGNGSTQAV